VGKAQIKGGGAGSDLAIQQSWRGFVFLIDPWQTQQAVQPAGAQYEGHGQNHCANLGDLDKERDVVGVALQMPKNAAEFLIGPRDAVL
jgi:hypothetical protein